MRFQMTATEGDEGAELAIEIGKMNINDDADIDCDL
jgi:hypothetical protein